MGHFQVEVLRASGQFASFSVVMAVKELLLAALSAWDLACGRHRTKPPGNPQVSRSKQEQENHGDVGVCYAANLAHPD